MSDLLTWLNFTLSMECQALLIPTEATLEDSRTGWLVAGKLKVMREVFTKRV